MSRPWVQRTDRLRLFLWSALQCLERAAVSPFLKAILEATLDNERVGGREYLRALFDSVGSGDAKKLA